MAQKQRMITRYEEFLSSVCFFSMVHAKICDPEVQSSSYFMKMVCCYRQPKIKPILLKIHVVVRVRVDPTESI
jgi:hypothetical protein